VTASGLGRVGDATYVVFGLLRLGRRALAHTIILISAGSTRVILRTTFDTAGADLASRLALL